jgi:hypothetical protein
MDYKRALNELYVKRVICAVFSDWCLRLLTRANR